jgi:hypothetical protein
MNPSLLFLPEYLSWAMENHQENHQSFFRIFWLRFFEVRQALQPPSWHQANSGHPPDNSGARLFGHAILWVDELLLHHSLP